MTPAQLIEELAQSPSLAVDTSTIQGHALFELANLVNRCNTQHGLDIRIAVSTLVYTERQAQARRHFGRDFRAETVRQGLASKGIEIESFTLDDAEQGSALLARAAPTQQAWQDLKWSRIARELKVTPNAHKRVSGTIDWFIAAHAGARDWVLVTDDQGPEFQQLATRTTSATLRDALSSLLNG